MNLCISNVKVGMRIKNLKEFCELTGLEYKDSTNSRDAALKLLSRYFEWEKEGRAFIITAVKPEPEPEPFHGNDLFSEDVRIALEAFFYNDPASVMFSKRELARVCGFVNPAYGTSNQPTFHHLAQSKKFSTAMIQLYLDKTDDFINGYCIGHLVSSIERLEERGLISVGREVYVREEIETKITSNDGEGHTVTVSLWRDATEREVKAHRMMFDKFKESRGLSYVNSSSLREYDKYRTKVYEKLEIAESREFLRIKYTGACTLDPSTVDEAYCGAKRRINKRTLAHCLSKIPDQVNKGYERYLDNFPKDPETGCIPSGTAISLMHTLEEEIEVREEIARRLVGLDGLIQPLRNARTHSELLQDIGVVDLPEELDTEERKQIMRQVAYLKARYEMNARQHNHMSDNF